MEMQRRAWMRAISRPQAPRGERFRSSLSPGRPLQVGVAVLVLLSCAYFYNGYGWAQTARYDPIWAFVEPGPDRGTLRIDRFLSDPEEGLNTGDWARNPAWSEHYYSNKAPGTSLLGIPFYLSLYHAERWAGLDPTSVRGVLVNAYLINLWVSVLPVAASAAFFLGLTHRLTGSRRRALVLTLMLYGGTLVFPFSTMLWGHTTAAAFAVISLALFAIPGRWRTFWSGTFAGLAVLTDYAAVALPLLLLAVAAVSRERRREVTALVLGGLGPTVAFVVYHWMLFGSPLTLASSYSPPGMLGEHDLGGLFGGVQRGALWGLTLSTRRGLFFFMPVLALSAIAAACLLRGRLRVDSRVDAGATTSDPDGDAGQEGRTARSFEGASARGLTRAEDREGVAWVAVGMALLVFLANLSFNGWHGGISAGPRYQIVALPFWIVLLAYLPERRWVGRALVVLGAVSFANMFVIASVSPMAPDAFRGSPLLFAYWKLLEVLHLDLGLASPPSPGGSLSRGSIHLYPTFAMRAWTIELTSPVIERLAVFNLGERLLGLRGVLSLVPGLIAGAGLGLWLWRSSGPDTGESAERSS